MVTGHRHYSIIVNIVMITSGMSKFIVIKKEFILC